MIHLSDIQKEFDTVELKRKFFSTTLGGSIGEFTRRSGTIDVNLVAGMKQELWIDLRCQILARDGKSATATAEFHVPATWWQHFKHRWFKGWLLRRFPVKLKRLAKTLTVDTAELYPAANIAVPDSFGGPVRFHQQLLENVKP